MATTDGGWGREYLDFLVRMARQHPATFVRNVVRWSMYSFAPGLTRRRRPTEVLSCAEVERSVDAFWRDGFVVLSDALTEPEAADLKEIVARKAAGIIELDERGGLPAGTLHGLRRYSFGEYGHSPEWEYLAHNERVLPIVSAIWEGRPFRAVGAGGDFVLPGGEWQPLHNDLSWKAAGERVPKVLTVNYYVSDVTESCGPIRHIPATAAYPPPPHRVIDRFEPRWMKESLLTGGVGYAVIRDSRAWHGGTPNRSKAPRYMPNLEYVLGDARIAEICGEELGGSAILDQVGRDRWIADFPSPGAAA